MRLELAELPVYRILAHTADLARNRWTSSIGGTQATRGIPVRNSRFYYGTLVTSMSSISHTHADRMRSDPKIVQNRKGI